MKPSLSIFQDITFFVNFLLVHPGGSCVHVLPGETRVPGRFFFRSGLNDDLPLPCGEPWL
jgi:hypothetical protein